MKKEIMDGSLGEGVKMDEKFGKFPIFEFANKNEDLHKLKDELMEGLSNLRMDNGVFYASTGEFYLKSWLRDNFYANLAYLNSDPEKYKQTIQTMLDYFLKIEKDYQKISWLIKHPDIPNGQEWRFIHSRTDKFLQEIPQIWGNLQIDSINQILYGVYLGESKGISIIRNEDDRKIIQLVIDMMEAINFHTLEDNGCWEEKRKVETSSIGYALTALTSMKMLGFNVKQQLLDNAHDVLNKLLPGESSERDVDMAQLNLIFPCFILDANRSEAIMKNIEDKLERKHGALRYKFDEYYNTFNKEHNRYHDEKATQFEDNEAVWSMYLSFASLSYHTLGNEEKAKEYAYRMIEETIIHNVKIPVINKESGDYQLDENGNKTYFIAKSAIPEIFYAHTDIPNDNIILAWCQSLAIVTLETVLGVK